MAHDVQQVESRRLNATQVEAMRVEGAGVRRGWAVRKQHFVGTMLRRAAAVEGPCGLGSGIDHLEARTFLHPAGDEPACAWNWNEILRVLGTADKVQSVRRCAGGRRLGPLRLR